MFIANIRHAHTDGRSIFLGARQWRRKSRSRVRNDCLISKLKKLGRTASFPLWSWRFGSRVVRRCANLGPDVEGLRGSFNVPVFPSLFDFISSNLFTPSTTSIPSIIIRKTDCKQSVRKLVLISSGRGWENHLRSQSQTACGAAF